MYRFFSSMQFIDRQIKFNKISNSFLEEINTTKDENHKL